MGQYITLFCEKSKYRFVVAFELEKRPVCKNMHNIHIESGGPVESCLSCFVDSERPSEFDCHGTIDRVSRPIDSLREASETGTPVSNAAMNAGRERASAVATDFVLPREAIPLSNSRRALADSLVHWIDNW